MNLMADLLKKAPGFETATRFARIAVALSGVAAAIFMAVKLAAPFCLDLLSSSLPAVWIAVQLIIVVVWKLSVVGDLRPREEKPPETTPPPVKERDPQIPPAAPLDRNPSSEFWREIQHPLADSGGIPPETVSKSPASAPKSCEPPPEAPFETSSRAPSRLEIKKSVKPPERVRTSEREEEEEADDSIDATWRAIMDGGATPVRPLLRKSDTWEGSPRVEALAPAPAAGRPELRKSKTFRESAPAARVGLRGREAAVVGRGDELSGRAEAFIKMHYDDLRMQRQESEHRRFMERVNHAY